MKPILAYRTWRLTLEHKLCSVIWGGIWTPNEVSTCELLPELKCPGECRWCNLMPDVGTYGGFHSNKEFISTIEYAMMGMQVGIVGGVYLWGTVEEHKSGYRATHAYPAWVKAWCSACKSITADAKLLKVYSESVVICRDCAPSPAGDTYDIGAEVSRLYGL